MHPRVLMIGLDGMTYDVLDPLIEEDVTPAIGRLVREGSRAPLETIFPPLTAAAWTSAVTGKNPGKHGILEFFLRRPGTMEDMAVNQKLRDSRAIWDLLGDAGIRSIVTNVPCTYPPEQIPGVMISDFLTPGGRRDFVTPDGLLDEIEAEFGPYRLHLGGTYRRGQIDSVVDELIDEIEYKTRVNRYLMEREEWGACFTHVWGTDRIQHELWHLFDPRHPRHDAEEAKGYRSRVTEYWSRVDDCVAQMVVMTMRHQDVLAVDLLYRAGCTGIAAKKRVDDHGVFSFAQHKAGMAEKFQFRHGQSLPKKVFAVLIRDSSDNPSCRGKEFFTPAENITRRANNKEHPQTWLLMRTNAKSNICDFRSPTAATTAALTAFRRKACAGWAKRKSCRIRKFCEF